MREVEIFRMQMRILNSSAHWHLVYGARLENCHRIGQCRETLGNETTYTFKKFKKYYLIVDIILSLVSLYYSLYSMDLFCAKKMPKVAMIKKLSSEGVPPIISQRVSQAKQSAFSFFVIGGPARRIAIIEKVLNRKRWWR